MPISKVVGITTQRSYFKWFQDKTIWVYILRIKLYKNLGFLNPSNHNGAMLLGLNGVVVKSHGGTDAYGFANAIKSTIKIVEDDFIQKLKGQWENQE